MKLTIEIVTSTHFLLTNPERDEFYVKSRLSGMGNHEMGEPDGYETCRSWSESTAELQAIGLARLIDLDRQIKKLIADYSTASSFRDWRIAKSSSKEQSDS